MKYDNKKPELLEGEPWFLIRGRDALAVKAIIGYADAAKEASDQHAEPELQDSLLKHALQIQKVANRFLEWQGENLDLVRMPKPEPKAKL